MRIRKIKNWLIRKLGGRPAEMTVDGRFYEIKHFTRIPVKLTALDIVNKLDFPMSDKYLAFRIADEIVKNKLCTIKIEKDAAGNLTRIMTVEVFPPIEGR